MDRVEITPEKLMAANARDLLQRYLYGDPADLDLLMRFAEEHGLSRDNMVWLMTSILKVNANLVRDLLSCIAGVQEAQKQSAEYQHEAQAELVRLVERLQAQIETTAARAVGTLDTVVSRFERIARDLTNFSDDRRRFRGDAVDLPRAGRGRGHRECAEGVRPRHDRSVEAGYSLVRSGHASRPRHQVPRPALAALDPRCAAGDHDDPGRQPDRTPWLSGRS